MDALDIMGAKEQLVPQYKPIFSADKHVVIGYEVCGIIEDGVNKMDLQPFFEDEAIPEEYRLEVEALLLRKTFDHYMKTDQSFSLFLKLNPNLLLFDQEEQFIHLVHEYHRKGLNMNKITMVMTEHHFHGDIQALRHTLTYYRTYGIQLAMNDVANENSNIKRIGVLLPDILKINIAGNTVEREGLSYQDFLYSLSFLAEKMGAVLLYEEISTFYHMQYAWKNNGRYYQGTYLHHPTTTFIDPYIRKDKLRNEFHSFIVHEKKKIEALRKQTEKFQYEVSTLLEKAKDKKLNDEFLLFLAKELQTICFRIYVCNEDGVQQSSNIWRNKVGAWEIQGAYKERNWSWRPYFLKNILEMRNNQKGRLSYLYRDIGSGEIIRTYSYPLQNGNYLFIDIPYEYLYAHDELL